METRFKRFISGRRGRSASVEVQDESSCQGAPYEASSPASRPPIFLYQPLAKSALEIRKDLEKPDSPMRSFSYEQAAAGKAPTFISTLPQKGNGPVKLQANRRLSSGELIAAVEDKEATLQDLKQGEYIVGRKERSMSSIQESSGTHVIGPRVSSISRTSSSSVISPSRSTPTASQTWPNTPSLMSQSYQSGQNNSAEPLAVNFGLGLSPPLFGSRMKQDQIGQADYHSTLSRQSTSQRSTTSERLSKPAVNATLEALRKAEYTRLVHIYGADAAARNIAQLDHDHMRTPTSPTSPTMDGSLSPVLLEPLPAPPVEGRDPDSRRTSRMSAASESEWSGSSSPQRRSYVSSYAESSNATTHTSVGDDEPKTTREDIRSMVEQMRSTYLTALEQRTPQTPRAKPRKKKARKPKLMASPALESTEQQSPRTAYGGRSTWHIEHDNDEEVQCKRRVNSQPATTFGRLSPIEASPSRSEDREVGLKRADSTTLGGLMADMTRSHLRSHRSSRRSNRTNAESSTAAVNRVAAGSNPQTPTQVEPQIQPPVNKESWLNMDSDSAGDSHAGSPSSITTDLRQVQSQPLHQTQPPSQSQPATDFSSTKLDSVYPQPPRSSGSLYEDIFGTDSNDFWSSSPTDTSSSLPTIASYDSALSSRPHGTIPRKAAAILSIPESPEYTSLAQNDRHRSNFI